MQIQGDMSNTTLLDPGQMAGIKAEPSTAPVQTVEKSQTQNLTPNQPQNQNGKSEQGDVQQSLKNVQKQLDLMKNTSFQLDYDKDIDRVIVKYVNNETGEVVSQIPSKDFVSFEKDFVKTIGLLFDKRV